MPVKKAKVQDVIKELGLPEDTKFLGYVIHLPNEDEFVGILDVKKDMTKRAFCKTPHHAKVYKDYKKAERALKHVNQLTQVNLLFDSRDQYFVSPVVP